MLGYNFYPASPRAVEPAKARQIMDRLPADVFHVALFVNAARERVNRERLRRPQEATS